MKMVDGTAKNCEIDERFSYSRFNAGKLEATALEDRIGEKGFSAIERFFFNRGRPRVYGPMVIGVGKCYQHVNTTLVPLDDAFDYEVSLYYFLAQVIQASAARLGERQRYSG